MKYACLIPLFALSMACTGPKPEVKDVSVKPDENEKGKYNVQVVVENKGRGEGQAKVVARLVDESGRSYQKEEQVDLKSHEITSTTIEIHAPVAKYVPEVEVEYPPQ